MNSNLFETTSYSYKDIFFQKVPTEEIFMTIVLQNLVLHQIFSEIEAISYSFKDIFFQKVLTKANFYKKTELI